MGRDQVVIRASGLRKAFGTIEVLKGVDLTVSRGEVVVIMGSSGSGKTTLIRCLNLLEEPDSGELEMCGETFSCGRGLRDRRRAKQIQQMRRRTAMVFQHFNLFPHMTALGNVIEGARYVHKLSTVEAERLGERLLAGVGLADKRDEYPSRLSGGQKQRVAIARAIAVDPAVILFDEPTSALDPELRAEVLDVIRKLAADGMTMVVVTHETQFAREVADRIVFMADGVVVEDTTPARFFVQPASPRAMAFLRLIDEH